MHFNYFLCLLLVVASLIATIEATVANEKSEMTVTSSRNLPVDKTPDADTDAEEERATMNLNGVFKDKAATNALLSTWLHNGESVQQVSQRLNLLGLPMNVAVFKQNWPAIVKFQRMHYTQRTGKTLPYAKFGGSLRTESETKEAILKWVMSGTSQEDAAISLGVAGLSTGELIVHQNYKAYKLFGKYQKEWRLLQASFE